MVCPLSRVILNSSLVLLRKLHNAFRLSPKEWLFFIEAWFWLLIFDIGLRTQPFSDLQAYAACLASQPKNSPAQTRKLICALQTAIDHARYNHLYPMTCLRRALTLQKMLAQRGIASELKIGVRKEADQLSAHAWLEYQGKPLGESEQIVEKFVELMKAATGGKQP